MKVPPKMQSELQDVKAEITKVETKIDSVKMEINTMKLNRNNAEESLLNASRQDNPKYISLLNSATAELARLGQKESDLRKEKSDLSQKEKTLLEVFL